MASLPAANGARTAPTSRSYKNCFASSTEELAFEKKLFDKTARTSAKAEAEIIILDGLVTVYRNVTDVWLYVVGGQSGETHPDPLIPHIPSVFGRIAYLSLARVLLTPSAHPSAVTSHPVHAQRTSWCWSMC